MQIRLLPDGRTHNNIDILHRVAFFAAVDVELAGVGAGKRLLVRLFIALRICRRHVLKIPLLMIALDLPLHTKWDGAGRASSIGRHDQKDLGRYKNKGANSGSILGL